MNRDIHKIWEVYTLQENDSSVYIDKVKTLLGVDGKKTYGHFPNVGPVTSALHIVKTLPEVKTTEILGELIADLLSIGRPQDAIELFIEGNDDPEFHDNIPKLIHKRAVNVKEWALVHLPSDRLLRTNWGRARRNTPEQLEQSWVNKVMSHRLHLSILGYTINFPYDKYQGPKEKAFLEELFKKTPEKYKNLNVSDPNTYMDKPLLDYVSSK